MFSFLLGLVVQAVEHSPRNPRAPGSILVLTPRLLSVREPQFCWYELKALLLQVVNAAMRKGQGVDTEKKCEPL